MSTTTQSGGTLLQPRPRHPETYQNYINGKWVTSSSTKKAVNVNPADTSDLLGEIPLSGEKEATEAVEAAAKAFPAWRAMPAPKRGQILWKAYQIMDARKNEL